jgi:hypothetical protein
MSSRAAISLIQLAIITQIKGLKRPKNENAGAAHSGGGGGDIHSHKCQEKGRRRIKTPLLSWQGQRKKERKKEREKERKR